MSFIYYSYVWKEDKTFVQSFDYEPPVSERISQALHFL